MSQESRLLRCLVHKQVNYCAMCCGVQSHCNITAITYHTAFVPPNPSTPSTLLSKPPSPVPPSLRSRWCTVFTSMRNVRRSSKTKLLLVQSILTIIPTALDAFRVHFSGRLSTLSRYYESYILLSSLSLCELYLLSRVCCLNKELFCEGHAFPHISTT